MLTATRTQWDGCICYEQHFKMRSDLSVSHHLDSVSKYSKF